MQKLLICLVIFTCLGVDTWASDGVKGGHRPRYPTSGNLQGNNSTQGLCYKRVPYSHVLALNSSSGSPYNTIPQPPEDSQGSSGWITILDCCDGYQRNSTSGRCEPHCDRGCFGGHCTGPNICTCQQGWRAEDGVCMPVCTRPCQPNAYCFSHEQCMCKLGYDEVNGECEPICPDGCRNGQCVEPRVCRCRPGFALNDHKECVPACEGGCTHGLCTAPGVCTCYAGYSNPPEDRETCVPDCSDCRNGDCVAPGRCNCRPGFRKDHNGMCVSDSASQCDFGYTADPDTGRCVPIFGTTRPTNHPQPTYPTNYCPYGCGDEGVCVGPNRCSCSQGYTNDQRTGRCVPLTATTTTNYPHPTYPSNYCPYGCGDEGVCVGPNRCSCSQGYTNDQRTGRCVPLEPTTPTTNCTYYCGQNSRCVGPNTCACNPGYLEDPNTGRCVRFDGGDSTLCPYPCLNGQCTGPNQCTCNRGYTVDVRDPTRSRCLPVCAGGCQNGVCTMPNYCICNLGYRKEAGVKGRQRCVPVE